MSTLSLGRYAAACTVITMLAGCGGSSAISTVPSVPAGGYGELLHHKTFRYTGNRQSFIVPSGVKKLSIVARGAMGGGPDGGGRVGRVSAIIPVKPGQQLYMFVGGPASGQAGGFNGGGNGGASYCECTGYGGGGASDIRSGGYKVTDRILVVGGGGGDGANGDEGSDVGGNGGPGGGSTAGAGGNGTGDDSGSGGGGGTQSHGGSGGNGASGSGGGIAGALGVGGDGGGAGSGPSGGGGGGGGGGYYGGGGGGAGSGGNSSDEEAGGGGGGGSSYIEPDVIKYRAWRGWNGKTPEGLIVLSW